jgi:IclR helix-turn-helix domain
MVESSKKCDGADLGSGVRSVERALRLLEQLSASGGANLSELARDTQLPLSTCHRLLTTHRSAASFNTSASARNG